MTARAPTWGEVADFLAIDGWRRIPPGERGGSQSDHIFYEKVLPDGRVLQTHVSHASDKRPSPGRFSAILRHQIEVSRHDFWQALRTRDPVERPVPLDESPGVEHEAWVVDVLVNRLHRDTSEIEALSEEEARARVFAHWSRPRAGDD